MAHLTSTVVATALFLAAGLSGCGGAFSRSDPEGSGDRGSSGGGSGSGGRRSGGRGGLVEGPKHCEFAGQIYAHGEEFREQDCAMNGCTCMDGTVACTSVGCIVDCDGWQQEYAQAMEQAKSCAPGVPGQCSQRISEGLVCGCDAMVNPGNAEALAQSIQERYGSAHCAQGVVCGPCAPAPSGYCSPEGRCESVHDVFGGLACMVGGVIYPSGASDIPDPRSCNNCQCVDGQLVCSERDCPVPCPPDTEYGTQCGRCGANDSCAVIEHACLPICTDSCETLCSEGLCKRACS